MVKRFFLQSTHRANDEANKAKAGKKAKAT
jgi:hypothetical protein